MFKSSTLVLRKRILKMMNLEERNRALNKEEFNNIGTLIHDAVFNSAVSTSKKKKNEVNVLLPSWRLEAGS